MTPQAEALLRKIEHSLATDVARDRRNQMVIDKMKRISWTTRVMLTVGRLNWWLLGGIAFCFLFWAWVGSAWSDELRTQCPTVGQPCKVLILSPQEEQMLMQTNGILDTAAQGRSLDLGQFSVYLKTRIAAAPAGDLKPLPQTPMQPTPGQQAPVSNSSPALDTPAAK